tara:strand:+ start:147 stop:599 length:453 start_codon:yes stop_codon:yes gene_type:complete
MYEHILVAIDLSPRSCNALKHAIKLAHLFNSKITLLNVHEEFLNKAEMIMSRVSVEVLQKTFRDVSVKAKKEIRHLIEDLDGKDIEIEIKIKDGKTASDEIVSFSNKINPDLIVMGSNGKDELSDYIIGTTASYVVDNSKYPVFVIPNTE